MFRVLTIVAAIVALAVSAAPASATTHLDNVALGTATNTASGTGYSPETPNGRRIQKFLRRGNLAP